MNRTAAPAVAGFVAGTLILTACHGGGSQPDPSGSHSEVRPTGFTRTTATSRPGGAEAPTSTTQDQCRIVSATAVKTVVGGTLVAETSGVSGVGNPVCMFELTKTAPHRDTRILFSANQSGTRARFRSTKAQTVGAKTIAGLGDDAFYVKATSTLQFIKGAKIVIIQATLRKVVATGAVGSAGQTVLVKLARAVLAQ